MDTETQLKNILLAEDDNDDVLVFELAIKELHLPINLQHVKDGEMLLVVLNKEVPDMLFLDILMPCVDGISCLSEIRKNSRYDNMPIIMLTGMKMQKNIEQAFRNGANFYLTKTHSIRELGIRLKKIFAMDWKNNMVFPTLKEFVID